jgi:hypothetical protein
MIGACELDSRGSGQVRVAGSCGHGNETPGYIEGQDKSGLPEQLSASQ